MINKTIGFRGLAYFQTNPNRFVIYHYSTRIRLFYFTSLCHFGVCYNVPRAVPKTWDTSKVNLVYEIVKWHPFHPLITPFVAMNHLWYVGVILIPFRIFGDKQNVNDTSPICRDCPKKTWWGSCIARLDYQAVCPKVVNQKIGWLKNTTQNWTYPTYSHPSGFVTFSLS